MISSQYKTISFLILIFCLTDLYAQYGLQIPEPAFGKSRSDTLGIVFSNPVLPMYDWHNFTDPYLEIDKKSESLDINQYISPDFLPTNPFERDLRNTSNYVPRHVRNELNHIMDRPHDGSFVPILPIAFIALQLASKYLLIRGKTEITTENIEKTKKAYPILEILWIESPQTLTTLYQKEQIKKNHTMGDLRKLIDLLIENNLVKTRMIENAEMKFFAAISMAQYQELQKRADAVDYNAKTKNILQTDSH